MSEGEVGWKLEYHSNIPFLVLKVDGKKIANYVLTKGEKEHQAKSYALKKKSLKEILAKMLLIASGIMDNYFLSTFL